MIDLIKHKISHSRLDMSCKHCEPEIESRIESLRIAQANPQNQLGYIPITQNGWHTVIYKEPKCNPLEYC